MKKVEKQELVTRLNSRLEKAQGTFLVEYQGLNVDALSRLRAELRKVNAEFSVVKNRLMKIASRDTDTSKITEHMTGPTAIAVSYDDVIGSAKVLVEFARSFDRLKIKVGQIAGKPFDVNGVKNLAELPGREALLAQALSAMNAVPASFVRVLNGVMVNFLNVLKAIEAQRGDQG